MAKLECELQGNFQEILAGIERAVLEGSMSASEEDGSDFFAGDCRCAVRVYERYSMLGGNRVSESDAAAGRRAHLFVRHYIRGQPGGLLEDEYLWRGGLFGYDYGGGAALLCAVRLTVRRKKRTPSRAPEQGEGEVAEMLKITNRAKRMTTGAGEPGDPMRREGRRSAG